MREIKYIITDELGIHARPAGMLAKLAKLFPCKITVEKSGKEVDAKGIMGIMSLGAKQGEEITVKADGEKEEEACRKLEEFLKENL